MSNLEIYTITNALVFVNDKFEKINLIIENNKIVNISNNQKGKIIKLNEDHLVLPSFIDIHTHLRQPGIYDDFTMESETYRAYRGGYQLVCNMPNTFPVLDNLKTYEKFKTFVQKSSKINVKSFVAITKQQLGLELSDFKSFINTDIIGFSDDGVGLDNLKILKTLVKFLDKTKSTKIIAMHCQDMKNTKNKVTIQHSNFIKTLGYQGYKNIDEYLQICKHAKILIKYPNARYHICHISTKKSLLLLKKIRCKNKFVTSEVTPHHLLLNKKIIKFDNGIYKVNPPLRSKTNQKFLIKALQKGWIQCIASDQAPHPKILKETTIQNAKAGLTSLEFMFPLLYTKLVLTKKLDLNKLINAMTINPAKIINYQNISIKENNIANLTIVNIKEYFKVKSQIKSFVKYPNPLFKNELLTGWISHIIKKGKIKKF